MMLQICLRMDEKFEKFEHNFAGLGMEMAELYKEYAKLKAEFCGQIALLENEVAKLRKENGILTSRLMMNNAAANDFEQNLANIQFMAANNDGIDNGIPIIKQENDVVEVIGICPCPGAEQQYENGQQNNEPKQHYTVNPLDELNETSADGFGQIEENGFDEKGDEIMPSNSMEMNGIRESRMDNVYDDDGNNLIREHEEGPGPSNICVNDENGQKQRKNKMKFFKCQWPGCGYGYRKAKCKTDMERHWRTHTGERPYCCSICGQSFARLDNMKKHELKQHNLL